jgi:hypothetical protein
VREENDQGFIVIANFSDNATGPISLIVPASAIKASSNNLALKPLLSHKGVALEQEGANYRAIITLDALETEVFAF